MQHIVFQAYVQAIHEHTERLPRLDQALHDHGISWRLPPAVEALQARRSVPGNAAVTMVAASGALTRFVSPRALLKFLGLILSEYPSAEQRRQGSMTKAGTTHARRALVEGAWAYRSPAKVSRHLPWRREKQPPIIQDIRWKAQVRLWKRGRQRIARGTHANVGTVAMARALVGCLWARAQEIPVTPYAHKTEPSCTRNAADFLRASAEAQPRCGVTLDGVKRLVQDTRGAREAGTRRMPGRWEPTHG